MSVQFSDDFVARAEISDNGRRIEVRFEVENDDWDEIQRGINVAKGIAGATFKPKNKTADGIPFWHFPLELETSRRLRAEFGASLLAGKRFRIWIKEREAETDKLRSIAHATTAKLERLPLVLPELARAIHLGPRGLSMDAEEIAAALLEDAGYQAADVKFMTECAMPMNSNQPGTGKTIETIASIFEAGTDDGPNLVVAPLTSINTVWVEHLHQWQEHEVLTASGGRFGRLDDLEDAMAMYYDGLPFWLVINPDMAQLKREFTPCGDHKKARTKEKLECSESEEGGCLVKLVQPFPALSEIHWNNVVLDEFHKMGLANPKTLTSQGLGRLRDNADKVTALSGTPIGGQIIKLWGILHFLYPEEYSSKWRFAHQWMEMEAGWGGNPKIGKKIEASREEAFWEMLSTKMTRRTKAEVLPWLPPKQQIPIWAEMGPAQAKQYEEFAREAEIRIEDDVLNATSVFAEYTRLKQFAMGVQRLIPYQDPETGEDKFRPLPTYDSCKIPHVLAILEERGIVGKDSDKEEEGGDEQVVIFSQFTTVIDMLTEYLTDIGIPCRKITGAVKQHDRDTIVEEFQADGGARVLLMNVAAGGVSITLDKASTAIFLDQTWNPDDKEQAEDRIHRGSRIHQVMVYTIRTKGTIEEYIETVNLGKEETNFNILDARRIGLRATGNIEIEEDDEEEED